MCIEHAKSCIKTILSKIFKQNIDYAKLDQFSTPSFKNDDVSRKIMTSLKKLCQTVDKKKSYSHAKCYCKTKSRSKVTEGVSEEGWGAWGESVP